MPDIITSSQNFIAKQVKSLHEKSGRDKSDLFFIEGLRFVSDAMETSAQFEYAVISDKNMYEAIPIIEKLQQRNTKTYYVSDNLFKEISDTNSPQGVLAVLKKNQLDKKDINIKKSNFFVILENLQDPGNMGTVIRTADAAGVDAVILSKGCVDIYNPKVLRSTMGSFFHLPILKVENLGEYIEFIKNEGFKVFAGHLKGEKSHFDADMKSKTAILVGNEANGLSDDIAKLCSLIKIPMPGRAESLNASISSAILIYECVRQRIKK